MARPQIILIPGAWHTPECFSIITPKLESYGYTVHSRQLPAVDNPNPPKDLSEDVTALREIVIEAIGSGNDVIVAPHSWSGIVAGSALTGLGKKEREARSEKGGVIRCAYMCSFMAPEGVSLLDALNHQYPDWWDPEGDYCITNPKAARTFYSDLPESEQERWYSKTKKHALATMKAKATGASWKEIPTSYLLCDDDMAIPKEAQEAMTGMVKDMGGEIEVERIKASHSPFLSRPDDTVNWLRRVAGEKI